MSCSIELSNSVNVIFINLLAVNERDRVFVEEKAMETMEITPFYWRFVDENFIHMLLMQKYKWWLTHFLVKIALLGFGCDTNGLP